MSEIFRASDSSASSRSAADPYRVLIVDDSAVIRGLLARAVEGNTQLRLAGTVGDGLAAIKALQSNPTDVIILDIEMPVMDGLTAIPELLKVDPDVKIVVASTLTLKNAEISMKAMALGAADYIPKPTSTREISGGRTFRDELVEKVVALGAAARKAKDRRGGQKPAPTTPTAPATIMRVSATAQGVERRVPAAAPAGVSFTTRSGLVSRPDIVAIGSSTGGPQALFAVIKDMGILPQPVVITQHMPPSFTTILADHISKHCNVVCTEAKNGMVLEPGKYYLAPGDYHMLLTRRDAKVEVKLTQDPPENFCRPAVDPMLRSLVEIYGKKILTVILTGMGADGCKGGEKVVAAGGAVIAQDEATSVVWGMPGAVATAGICSAVLPLAEIGGHVRQIASRAS